MAEDYERDSLEIGLAEHERVLAETRAELESERREAEVARDRFRDEWKAALDTIHSLTERAEERRS